MIRTSEALIPGAVNFLPGLGLQVSNGELATTLERVAEGDRVAFRNLYQAVGPKLFSLCKRLLRDHDAAQDALQDVMLRIWEKSPLFDRTRGDAMGWMLALARNVVFNRLSQRPAAALSLSDDEVASVVERLSVGSDPSLGQDLRRCLGGLKEEHRRCVVMAYHYGLSYEELSALAAVPLGTVKSWIHRAIGQLQTCLNQ
ncbi:sigma-70 family RNA polymerase sigma factor [Bradyrhizobium sp.]|uniref:sigma-70 family RNA polymerase sigma factor n=1 Tax=Bradyrhizobium sp. TaxID=376 RepID=UPI001D79236F|nr:sigma-70 family RNA polymerase sigma factor [Bradyrhizobium sp.]MBI5321981.1 sigma-70 family RNA polymerase sigma factor [Bradyrhizobium sp.]